MASVQSGGEYLYEELSNSPKSPQGWIRRYHQEYALQQDANQPYCIVDAPNKNAISKHHQKFGLKCDWITEVKTTAWEKSVGSSGANFRVLFTVMHSVKHIYHNILLAIQNGYMHHIINFVKPALKS